MDANSESRSINWATRNHGHARQNSPSRRLVSARSRGGAVKSRNHFTTTEHGMVPPLPAGERPDGKLYVVRKGKKKVGTYTMLSQAEAIAHAKCGYVEVVTA